MLVRELSPTYVASCRPDTNLATAAALLWEHDCGILPVVDDAYKVLGVLTDRDICMAVATRNETASRLVAREVMSQGVHSVAAGDTAAQALKIMRKHHVRRLPITTAEGILEGIVSLNDLFLAAKPPKEGALESPSYEDLIQTMKAICGHVPAAKGQPSHGLALA